MFRFVTLFALVALCAGASFKNVLRKVPTLDGRIVGGFEVDISDHPYQISLQYFGSHICGGSIISENWVLTAAHCTEFDTADTFQIRTGSTFSNREGEIINIAQKIEHPNYNTNTLEYDFSLLNLASSVSFSDVSNQIPTAVSDVDDGAEAIVSGWGNTQVSGDDLTILRAVQVYIVNQDECSVAYADYGGVQDSMICAGVEEGGRDSCQGDSGGPMTVDGVLVGVVSWGVGCGVVGFPGVYSRVSHVADWIQSTTA